MSVTLTGLEKSLRERLPGLVGIAVLAALVLFSTYYSYTAKYGLTKTVADPNSPDFIAHGTVTTEFAQDGTPYRRFSAEYSEHYNDGRFMATRPRAETLDPSKPRLTASADQATSTDDGGTVLFTGNVLVTRAADAKTAPLRFSTTHATVYPDASRMTTDAPVEIVNGANITTGTGFDYDNVDHIAQLHSKVHSVYIPKPSPTAEANSDSGE